MFDAFTLNELIREHGRVITLRVLANGTYSATTGTLSRTPTDYSVRAYFYNDVPQITENTAIVYGSKRAVISSTLVNGSATPQPSVQDLIVYSGGDTTAISKVSPLTSGGSPICYLLHLEE